MSEFFVPRWFPTHNDPLSLPIDRSKKIHARGSYKSPGRIKFAFEGPDGKPAVLVEGWRLWFVVGDALIPLNTFDRRRWKQGGLVFEWKERHDGRSGPVGRGVNGALARRLGLETDQYAALRDADQVGFFATSPDGDLRTRVFWSLNDISIERSGELPKGNGPGTRNAKVPIRVLDHPPAPAFRFKRGEEKPPPETGDEPDERPELWEFELAEPFRRWRSYPKTIDLGRVTVEGDADEIVADWTRDLSDLPRYEDGGRFGRLCFGLWAGGRWIGGHGEHTRKKENEADESLGASIERWAGDGLTLSETLERKSKLDVEIDLATVRRLCIFFVTHDQNDRPQRSPLYWFGEPWPDDEDDPGPDPDMAERLEEIAEELERLVGSIKKAVRDLRA